MSATVWLGIAIVAFAGLLGWAIYADATDGVKCVRGHWVYTVRWDINLNTVMPDQYWQCDEYAPAPEELE